VALIDLKYATIEILDGSTPPHALVVNLGTGNLEYTEARSIEFVKRRGELETVREGEEQPVDLSFQFAWESLAATQPGDPPTVEDALKRRGPAAGWKSTSPDPLAPYCVDVVVTYRPPCGVGSQTIGFAEFHYEELAHSMADATVDVKGKCNTVQASVS
jgi:hypothetical protein